MSQDRTGRRLKVSESLAWELCELLHRACETLSEIRDRTEEACVLPESAGGGLGHEDYAETLYEQELEIGAIRDALRRAGWEGGGPPK